MNNLQTYRDQIISIAERYGATNIRVFGSTVRGDAGPHSDVDLLVDFKPGFTLLTQAALTRELENVLKNKVDVVSARALRPRVREKVLKEAVPL